MPTGDSALGQLIDIVPVGTDSPTVPAHLQGIVDAIERQLVLRVATSGASVQASFDTVIPSGSQQNGMLGVILAGTYAGMYFRVAGTWVRIYGNDMIRIVTSDPAPGDGQEGSITIKVDP